MDRVNITIIGAGVIGLSIAAELSKRFQDILIIERHPTFGQETSSRNSEVIHAGIYYPRDSLKAKTCVEGNRLLYEFCVDHNVAHKRIGKLIVANNALETDDLEKLFKQGQANGARRLEFIYKDRIKHLELHIEAESAIYSADTGIIDTHSFMKALVSQLRFRQGTIAYNTELTAIEHVNEGYIVSTAQDAKEAYKFFTRVLINCAGLYSDKISQLLGLKKEEYKLKYCKGDYFRVCANKSKLVKRLIYPVPKKHGSGLGIHATLDLVGSLRLGPDEEYIEELNYDINPKKAGFFYEDVRRFLPFIEVKDLSPDIAGIRPKLQGPNEGFRDFIIKEEVDNGFPGFINLIGIESPGFTASLSIAKLVRNLIKI
jgi:L-2-hydroxyglutarate oxidase LhgO